MSKHVPALIVVDQGTSATKTAAFDPAGQLLFLHSRSTHTHRPHPGHAEVQPEEILRAVDITLERTLSDLSLKGYEPVAMGLSAQRSSFLFWNTRTDRALTPVLSWQDTRATYLVEKYSEHQERIYELTGIPLAPYYGALKYRHLVSTDPQLESIVMGGKGCFIPVESLLVHHLTGNWIIDETIAGRTQLFDIHNCTWSMELLDLFDVPLGVLPECTHSSEEFGLVKVNGKNIPLRLAMGDQQAAMTGLGARKSGDVAINYGTSGSVMFHTGKTPQHTPGLLVNIAHSAEGSTEYLLEGTVNGVGSLFTWLEDEYHCPGLATDWPAIMVESTNLVLIPGINGLAAPHWRPDLKTTWVPEDSRHSLQERCRAAMESICFLVADIISRYSDYHNLKPGTIHCGGGAARPALLQFQADLIRRSLHLHRIREASARGAAIRLAEILGWSDFSKKAETAVGTSSQSSYFPVLPVEHREAHLQRWFSALGSVLGRIETAIDSDR